MQLLLLLIYILIITYLLIIILIYIYQNPKPNNHISVVPSSITHSHIGLRGDMGNQMFQIACLVAAAKRSQAKVILPTRIDSLPINNLFDLSMFERKDLTPDATYYEYDNYEEIILPKDGRIYNIRGYRQSYEYFDDFSKEIRDLFTPKQEILNQVRQNLPDEYIAVHIRKGDYIKKMHKIPLLREFRRCQLEYYQEAIKQLRTIHSTCPILVCTDSPQWVTPLLSQLDSKAVLAPIPKGLDAKFSDYCTLYLATVGIVISNSTFSWMAAYGRNNRIVICPSPWWDPDGFISNGLNLDKPYLQHPDWWVLDTDTGNLIRKSVKSNNINHQPDTLNIYRLIRGMLL